MRARRRGVGGGGDGCVNRHWDGVTYVYYDRILTTAMRREVLQYVHKRITTARDWEPLGLAERATTRLRPRSLRLTRRRAAPLSIAMSASVPSCLPRAIRRPARPRRARPRALLFFARRRRARRPLRSPGVDALDDVADDRAARAPSSRRRPRSPVGQRVERQRRRRPPREAATAREEARTPRTRARSSSRTTPKKLRGRRSSATCRNLLRRRRRQRARRRRRASTRSSRTTPKTRTRTSSR